jgi:hypothetical protein
MVMLLPAAAAAAAGQLSFPAHQVLPVAVAVLRGSAAVQQWLADGQQQQRQHLHLLLPAQPVLPAVDLQVPEKDPTKASTSARAAAAAA